MVHGPTFMAYELRLLWRTNPDFMPYEPFLLGVGVVFNIYRGSAERFPHSEKKGSKKGSAEPLGLCRALGAKPSFSGPVNCSPKITGHLRHDLPETTGKGLGRDIGGCKIYHVFLNPVQQTVSGNKSSQYPLDTIRWDCLGAL